MTHIEKPERISVDRLETVIGYIRDTVAMFRRRGHKTEYVIPEIAGLLDTKPHRIRSLFYRDKLWPMSVAEASRIERRFTEHLDREIALNLEYIEVLRAKRDQLTMRLSCDDAGCCAPMAGIAWGGSRSRSAG